jgi:hypothetical protein
METTTFEVDGHKYDFDAFGALEAAEILGRVYGILGDGLKSSTGAAEGGPALIITLVGGLMSNLGDDRTVEILKRFAGRSRVHVNGDILDLGANNCANLDLHFERRIVPMGEWFVKCFTFQYSDFLDYAKNTVLLRLVALERLVSTSLGVSTGSSGESSPASESPTQSSPSSESGA